MSKQSLQEYIGKRIRLLRLQKGMTQEQLEEKADLGVNYVYKLENLATNMKVHTLEKVMAALETDLASFFDVQLQEDREDISQLVYKLKELPEWQQEKVIAAFDTLIEQMK